MPSDNIYIYILKWVFNTFFFFKVELPKTSYRYRWSQIIWILSFIRADFAGEQLSSILSGQLKHAVHQSSAVANWNICTIHWLLRIQKETQAGSPWRLVPRGLWNTCWEAHKRCQSNQNKWQFTNTDFYHQAISSPSWTDSVLLASPLMSYSPTP